LTFLRLYSFGAPCGVNGFLEIVLGAEKEGEILGWLQGSARLPKVHRRSDRATPLSLERRSLPGEDMAMIAERIPALQALSPDEKLILAGELWEELAAHPETFPERADHLKILQERLEHYRQHPEDVTAWEDVKARILASR
jgi:putative addiction module component (TIGR02574 family)